MYNILGLFSSPGDVLGAPFGHLKWIDIRPFWVNISGVRPDINVIDYMLLISDQFGLISVE